MQAGAARVVIARDPVKAKQALVSIEGSSRQAVLELHRLLDFLRQEGDADDLAPQPGLDQLDSLAASMHGSRLSVAISVEGERSRRPSTSRPTGSCRGARFDPKRLGASVGRLEAGELRAVDEALGLMLGL
ncbi:MAG: hypothetical protein QOK16_1070 [Solirubrobacteraceae bacterium]|nr:hypothetical protein [Solirubrobacteraceae bacterium]